MVGRSSNTVEHVMGSIGRIYCALRGHEDYMQFDKNRVYLQCVVCGHESPGWTVENKRPLLRFQARPAAKRVIALLRKTA